MYRDAGTQTIGYFGMVYAPPRRRRNVLTQTDEPDDEEVDALAAAASALVLHDAMVRAVDIADHKARRSRTTWTCWANEDHDDGDDDHDSSSWEEVHDADSREPASSEFYDATSVAAADSVAADSPDGAVYRLRSQFGSSREFRPKHSRCTHQLSCTETLARKPSAISEWSTLLRGVGAT